MLWNFLGLGIGVLLAVFLSLGNTRVRFNGGIILLAIVGGIFLFPILLPEFGGLSGNERYTLLAAVFAFCAVGFAVLFAYFHGRFLKTGINELSFAGFYALTLSVLFVEYGFGHGSIFYVYILGLVLLPPLLVHMAFGPYLRFWYYMVYAAMTVFIFFQFVGISGVVDYVVTVKNPWLGFFESLVIGIGVFSICSHLVNLSALIPHRAWFARLDQAFINTQHRFSMHQFPWWLLIVIMVATAGAYFIGVWVFDASPLLVISVVTAVMSVVGSRYQSLMHH